MQQLSWIVFCGTVNTTAPSGTAKQVAQLCLIPLYVFCFFFPFFVASAVAHSLVIISTAKFGCTLLVWAPLPMKRV